MQNSISRPSPILSVLMKFPQLRESYFRICELDPENSDKHFLSFITLQIRKLREISYISESAQIFRAHYQLISLKVKPLRLQTVQGQAIAEIQTDCGSLRIAQGSLNEITIKDLNSLEIQLSTVKGERESDYSHIDLLEFLSLLDIYALSSLQFTYQYATQHEDIVFLFELEKNTRIIDLIEAYKSEHRRKILEVGVKELEELLKKLKTLNAEREPSGISNALSTYSRKYFRRCCNLL